jgi:D-lyxose ketol-isomerase
MITVQQQAAARRRAAALLERSGLAFRPEEVERIEVADFGLSELEQSGAQIMTVVETKEIAAKLLIMFPGQTEPEHKHPRLGDYPGKEETLRCQWGELLLYVEGEPAPAPRAQAPPRRRHTYTAWKEIVLRPGDQVTLPPNSPHWFQGGPEGAVVWTFAARVTDVADVFTDPQVVRQTVVVDR